MTAGVLCAVRGSSESGIVRALGGSAARLHVTRRCADLAELLACAAAGLGEVVVVSADQPGLDREAVRHLHGSDAWVVVVAAPSSGPPPEALGADVVLDATTVETALVPAVVGLLDEVARTGARPGARGAPLTSAAPDARPGTSGGAGGGDQGLAVDGDLLGGAEPGRRSTGVGDRATDHVLDGAVARARGSVVAVWGPTGAPGRSTIALNLAAELAEHSRSAELAGPAGAGALLVDADTYGGSIAQLLGLLDEAPGVAAAARAAATGRLDAHTLASLTPQLTGGLRVLTGISRPDRWPELPAANLEVVWSAARDLAAWTVVDCGFSTEQDEALSYDTRAPRRNAATLSALQEADVVVVVGTGDPIGLQRLVRALGDLAELGLTTAARQVVVNRVRASASGPRPAEAIREALLRYAGVREPVLVPEDRPACDGAVLAARTLGEHAPGSPARRAVGELAAGLLARAAPVGAH